MDKENFRPALLGGDRILVAKFLSGTPAKDLRRHDLIVFRFPPAWYEEKPRSVHYVNRLVGLPGETLALHYGRIYRAADLKYAAAEAGPRDLWQQEHMQEDDPRAVKHFEDGKFQIIRKSPAQILAMRLPVHNDDFPTRDRGKAARWTPAKGSSWAPDKANGFQTIGEAKGIDWLTYRHLVHGQNRDKPKPELITDFFSYNSVRYEDRFGSDVPGGSWVGDLLLECEVTVVKEKGQVWLELTKGVDRFQARWDLATGRCALFRLGPEGLVQELANRPTGLGKVGTYRLRFANVDERLTVWVNEALPFGDGVEYAAPKKKGPTAQDLEPARIGGRNAQLVVRRLQLWRDTYYTQRVVFPETELRDEDWSDPDKWRPLRELRARTLYVQPGHYFVLGDNSSHSSDSRHWGVVPETLID